MIKERLEAWKANNNGNLPETILWYRDGVSESQLSTISHFEIPEIEKAYAELSGTTNEPKIMFMVVGKRHNTRFYAKNEADTYTSYNKNERRNIVNGNLKPGLLVSDVVTAPGPTNFFLQSHCAIKGTARSAHYYILHNTTNISVRNLQELTMMLCYTFGRSTTGVSYAAPAYIADRLCDRGRAYLRPWAEDKFAQPVFEYNQHKDAQGKKRKSTDTEIKAEKQDMINKLLKSWVWNANYNDGSDTRKPTRLNPWHENLDGGMFWI
jgi:eukaryotic translation initiation factor 2C